METLVNFVREYFKSLSINSIWIKPETMDKKHLIDSGLRESIYTHFDYHVFLHNFLENCALSSITFLLDEYGCRYAVVKLNSAQNWLTIGPYRTADDPVDFMPEFLLGAPAETLNAVHTFYTNLTLWDNPQHLEKLLIRLIRSINDPQYPITTYYADKPLVLSNDSEYYTAPSKEAFATSTQRMNKRYELRANLREAVSRGDAAEALRYASEFQPYTFRRFSNPIIDSKKWLIINNTALKIVAEQANVPPYYINAISTKFAFELEDITSEKDQFPLFRKMITEYSEMILQHKQHHYSPVVQQIIMQIDYDLTQDLSLSVLASQYNISESYLSRLFKKEVGVTLTSFITQQRLKLAKRLLTTTAYSVGTIAQLTGFDDLAYFTKVFKTRVGSSPTIYRKNKINN